MGSVGVFVFLVILFVAPNAVAAIPPVEQIAALIEKYNVLNKRRVRLSIPEAADITRLRAGKVISYREKIPGKGGERIYRVTAYVVVPASRIRVWVATLGHTESHDSELIELALSTNLSGGAVWYQYLSLPWPIADRHWVLRTAKQREISNTSANSIWEHSWDLEIDGAVIAAGLIESGKVNGVKRNANRKAVYLPANSGGWIMASIDPGSTLVAIHATAELGGRLPDAWVAGYVRRKLSKVLGKLAERTRHAEQALGGPIPLFTGAGLPITSEMLSVSGAN